MLYIFFHQRLCNLKVQESTCLCFSTNLNDLSLKPSIICQKYTVCDCQYSLSWYNARFSHLNWHLYDLFNIYPLHQGFFYEKSVIMFWTVKKLCQSKYDWFQIWHLVCCQCHGPTDVNGQSTPFYFWKTELFWFLMFHRQLNIDVL